nr:hypothetical protein [Tanacetum cinerariifolium]
EEEETTEKEEESFDPIPRTPEESEDDGNGEEDQGVRISEEERMQEEEAYELYRDVDINQGRGLQVSHDIEDSHVTLTPTHSDGQQESSSTSSFVTNLLNPIINPGMESIFTIGLSSITPIPSPKSTMTPSIITTTTTTSQPPIPPTAISSDILQTLPTFASLFRFEDRVKSLEVNFSKFMRTNQSSHSSRASYVVAADLSEMERKKILIDKMEGNQEDVRMTMIRKDLLLDQEGPSAGSDWGSKRQREGGEHASASTPSEPATRSAGRSTTGTQSRQRSASESAFAEEPVQTTCQMEEPSHPVFETDEQRNLYKALVEAYDADKTILDTYGESAILKRRREDYDQEGSSAGLDRGSKRRREGGEHASASTPSEPVTRSAGRLPVSWRNPHIRCLKQDRDWNKTLPATQGNAQSCISALAKQNDARSSFNELLDTSIDFSNFIMNLLGVNTLTPELLAGPTYELMRGSFNQESALDVYSKRRIIAVTELKIVEWHNYKHLDWISVRRDDEKIYKFKEGNLKRLRLQDIEDMLLLLVQGKLSNLTVEERFAFNVSLRMFTMSIVIQRRVKDL